MPKLVCNIITLQTVSKLLKIYCCHHPTKFICYSSLKCPNQPVGILDFLIVKVERPVCEEKAEQKCRSVPQEKCQQVS